MVRSCGLSAVWCNDPRAPRLAGGGDCNICLSPSGEGKDSDDAAPQSVDKGRATHHPSARGEPEQQAPHGSATKEEEKSIEWAGAGLRSRPTRNRFGPGAGSFIFSFFQYFLFPFHLYF